MLIRNACENDRKGIIHLCEEAFAETERTSIARLAVELLATKSTPPTLSLVAEKNSAVAGYASFSPLALPTRPDLQAYILAPLAVLPERQKQGIGSALIKQGLAQLKANGVNIALVYGDPAYYGRFGFDEAIAKPFRAPYALQYPFGWLGLMFQQAAVGSVSIPVTCVEALNKAELW